ncbi:PorP/SprF family type IX secretion system membrane protein [Phaeocystidibacter luteus]|uniref:Type IX secretion system membrane protein PorP/SprF n=1 Tax=Phaeocystidibacter luteus TaxID=911197 RepID=A0A6N6RKP4_9FLAO|nr:type IX secretion system membrane protein PorP/SprF [Phaeocystidibacter luteus]KAB2813680.1 type IX secretion system membrane protein PorP/SprF [Phaeocystidibacter luteus]
MKPSKRNNIDILGGYKAEFSSEHAHMKKLLFLLLVGAGVPVFAQQDIQFTQFMNNRLYYNPGVAGSSGSICITGMHRSQWVGFENAPVTQNLNVDVPIKLLHGGVYLNIVNDQIGFFQNVYAGLGYAYQMEMGEGTLGIGVAVDIYTNQIKSGESYIVPDPGAGLDPSIINQGTSGTAIDGTFGIYYQGGPMWFGASTRRLIGATTEFDSQAGSVTELQHTRHYFLMGGYDIPLSGTNIVLTPAAMVKFDESALNPQADINLSAMYNNQIWGGVTYRVQDAISLMAGYRILPELQLAYSYDLTTSDLNSSSSGSHEISVNYCFKIAIPERKPGRYANPTWLL